MRIVLSVLSVLAVACTLLLTAIPDGHAVDKLDQYRMDGVIAERYDGYTETKGAAPSDAAALVQDVNRQRRAIYEKRAEERNVPVSVVGTLFAKKIAEKGAPRGTYFKMKNGTYKQK